MAIRRGFFILIVFSLFIVLSPAASEAGFFSKSSDGDDKPERTFAGAQALEKQGNSAAAVGIYKELIAKDDDDTESRIAIARIYRKHGNYNEAVDMMLEAQKKKPSDEAVLANLGYAFIAANKPEDAVAIFDMLTAINHDSVAGYNGKAVAFDKAGNHVAAQEIYQKALALSPKSLSIQNNLAMSLILNNQVDTAIGILEPLSESKNAPDTVLYNLALAYGIKGDMRRAHETNLRIMPADKADQNQFFYEQYATLLKKQKEKELKENSKSSFMDASDDSGDAKPVDLKPAAGPKPLTKPAGVENNSESIMRTSPEKAPKNDSKFWGYDAIQAYPADKRN